MIEWFSTFSHCALYGQPILAFLHFFGDAGTFFAYVLIPIAIEIVRRKRQIPFNGLAMLFAGFIFLCGFGHFLATITMTTGDPTWYWIEGINKWLTAVVSLVTAVYCFKLIPVIENMPSAQQYQELQKVVKLYRDAERWRQFGVPLPK
jgi:hypothetical protein